MSPDGRRSLTGRMVGAALLSVDTYEDVEHDESATGQAAAVVAMAAVAQGVAASGQGTVGIVGGVVGGLLAWLVWSGVTYLVGDRLFGGTADWGELLRTLGFAHAPALLLLLAVVPLFGVLVRIVVSLWMLVAGFLAIRQALDFGNGKTFLTVVVGWVGVAVLNGLLGT